MQCFLTGRMKFISGGSWLSSESIHLSSSITWWLPNFVLSRVVEVFIQPIPLNS